METSSSEPALSKKKFLNWNLSNLALMYTRNGLKMFVFYEIRAFRDDMYSSTLKKFNLKEDTHCSDCTTNAIAKNECKLCEEKPCRHIACPKGVCNEIKEKIEEAHLHKKPSWNNTDAREWCKGDPWQIAKCYMPKQGYSTQKTIEETDINGILSVILNHKTIATKLLENVKEKNNIFQKARTFSNRIRHEANLEIDDEEFEEILSVLSKVLEVNDLAKTKEASDAKQNIMKIRKFSREYDIPEESVDNDLVQKIKQKVELLEQGSTTDIRLVLDEIECIFEKYKEIRERNKMCQKLREYYEKECSTLPISALFEDEDAPLLSFYVKPLMQQVSYHRVCTHYPAVNSYADIFHRDKEPVQKIYITGDAGIGKTAVCQRMVLCWCHAINGGTENENFTKEDIDSMKCFNFLFYVSLREAYFCDVTTIIVQQLKSIATQEFIEKVLDEENCLIILDGLDEWTHKQSCCMLRRSKIPNRKTGKNLTFLTTTRPWKIEAYRLKSSEIDQQIILKGLDQETSEALTCYVINHLNSRYNTRKEIQDFRESYEKQEQINNVLKIPIIKIQLITLWFNDVRRTNYSRSSIYYDTVKMLFERAIAKNKMQDAEQKIIAEVKNVKETEKEEHDTLSFLAQDDLLSEFQTFLFKIGYLAFDMLFKVAKEENEDKEESALVFESNVGKKYGLRDAEMEFALFVGILSTNKAIGPRNILVRLKKLTFLHKSYQEYFAAMYITMKKDPGRKVKDIFSKLGSVGEILKYENFFVFLTGMKIEFMTMISNGIRKIVSSDRNVQTYRKSAYYKFGLFIMRKPYHNLQSDVFTEEENGRGTLKSLQTFLLHCLDESTSAYNTSFDIPLSDVFINGENNSRLNNIIQATCQHMKSVSTELYCAELTLFKNLEKLVIMENTYSESYDDFKKYEICISSSKSSLVSLSIANCTGVRVFNDLKKITSLALFDIILTHQELLDIFEFITKTEALVQLFICKIKCSDHRQCCKGSTLDLRKHSDLKYLRLQDLYDHGSHTTRLNNANLELLVFQCGTNGGVVKNIIEDIKNAPKLKELVFVNFKTKDLIEYILDVVPTITCLERLSFFGVDFGESLVALNADKQKSINMVTCTDISLTFESICALVETLPTKGVAVHLLSSNIIRCKEDNSDKKDMEDVAKYVEESTSFKITHSDKFSLSFQSQQKG